jgi:hypothetical protein
MEAEARKLNELQGLSERVPALGVLRLDLEKTGLDKGTLRSEVRPPSVDAQRGTMTVELKRGVSLWTRLRYQLNPEGLRNLRAALSTLPSDEQTPDDQPVTVDRKEIGSKAESKNLEHFKSNLESVLEWQSSLRIVHTMNEQGERIEGDHKDLWLALDSLDKGLRQQIEQLRALVANQRGGRKFLSALLQSRQENLTLIGLWLMSESIAVGLQEELAAASRDSALPSDLRRYCHGHLLPEARRQLAGGGASGGDAGGGWR